MENEKKNSYDAKDLKLIDDWLDAELRRAEIDPSILASVNRAQRKSEERKGRTLSDRITSYLTGASNSMSVKAEELLSAVTQFRAPLPVRSREQTQEGDVFLPLHPVDLGSEETKQWIMLKGSKGDISPNVEVYVGGELVDVDVDYTDVFVTLTFEGDAPKTLKLQRTGERSYILTID